MLPEYLIMKDDKVIFDGDGELIYYVPEKYFTTKNAVIEGEHIVLMGEFNYDVFSKSGKSRGLKIFNYPSMFMCKPNRITKEEMQLKGTRSVSQYRLLHFSKGDELVCSIRIPKSIKNAEKFIDILLRGNLQENIPYDTIHELLPQNAEINGFKYNMTNQMYGFLISELCRSKDDPTIPFRNTDMRSPIDYQMVSINQLPKYISPYTAITSENADEAIAAAILNKNTHKTSPLEKVMMN